MIFGIIILILFVLSVWRKHHQRYCAVKFKYKIYHLRDKLRTMAMNNDIEKNSWIFDFFDNSFSKSVSGRYHLTLVRLMILDTVHKDQKQISMFSSKLEQELSKNPKLTKLRDEYVSAIEKYVTGQHYVSYNFIIRPIGEFVYGAKAAAEKMNSRFRSTLIYPETSDSGNFAY